MKLIDNLLKFLGFKSKAGRPRIPQLKRDAILSAPSDMTDAELARVLKLSYTTIQRYRYANGKQTRKNSQGTP